MLCWLSPDRVGCAELLQCLDSVICPHCMICPLQRTAALRDELAHLLLSTGVVLCVGYDSLRYVTAPNVGPWFLPQLPGRPPIPLVPWRTPGGAVNLDFRSRLWVYLFSAVVQSPGISEVCLLISYLRLPAIMLHS